MDKEFKELRDKIGKIWEAEEEFSLQWKKEQLNDTEIEIIIYEYKDNSLELHNKAFEFFQTYGYFSVLNDFMLEELTFLMPRVTPGIGWISRTRTSNLVIDLAKLDVLLNRLFQLSLDPEEPDDYEINYLQFIEDLKKVVKIMGGPQKFKIFYDEKNKET